MAINGFIISWLLLLLSSWGLLFASTHRTEYYYDKRQENTFNIHSPIEMIRSSRTQTRQAARPILLGADRSRWIGDGSSKRTHSPQWFINPYPARQNQKLDELKKG